MEAGPARGLLGVRLCEAVEAGPRAGQEAVNRVGQGDQSQTRVL